MASQDKLKRYRAKRDFRRTTEPADGKQRPSPQPIFVIQKHDASHLHYDLRLEVDGVLKSWAVPKGPSTNPPERRLAVATEDHPLEYARFEGVIPPGEYGGGTVLVWDTGTYRNLGPERGQPAGMEQALAQGHAEVWLEGKKLRGGYALIRTGRGDEKARWLLVKMKDEHAGPSRDVTGEEPRSALSGRSLEEIARESRA